ncbi:MAG: magnesium transporter [Hyphomicrobiaceae bacterium]|jgi:magnesium transporter|nr:magnesium transporter [Hyphomicrobiaceae bacterium]
MAEQDEIVRETEEEAEERAASLVDAVAEALHAGDTAEAVRLTHDMRVPDLADLIELLVPEQRVALIQALGPAFDFEVLSELDYTVRDQLSEALPNELLARAVTELDTDDAAYLLENLEEEDKEEILAQLGISDRAALERNLEYPEETAGRLMQSEFVAAPPFWSVGRLIDYMREAKDLPETFSEIFVVDPSFRVMGSVGLSRLLRTKRDVPIEQIMEKDRHVVLATDDQEEVARQFGRYDLMSAPVVDANNRLVGVLTVDDVVEVIQDEADEDMRALGGVGDESLGDSVLSTLRSRIPWLLVNLGTAVLASTVIQAFDATIQQMVALAVLMPIVASMGGNAGTQTMTVTVRALATNKLGRVNARRVITREALVGLANGAILSVVMAGIVVLWFGASILGWVIGAAMIVNLLAAALAGILIPLGMDWLDLDPAPASGVFVTMVTDVVGFFAFLGLATLMLT